MNNAHVFCLAALTLLAACDRTPGRVALGTLERDRIAHSAAASEVIVDLPVAQGSLVKRGAILVQLDDSLQKAQVAKAEAEVARAKANLEKLRNGARPEELAAARARVAGAKAVLAEGEAHYERLHSLVQQKAVSKVDLDKALAARDVAQFSLKAAQEDLRALTNGTRAEDLRAALAQLDAANAVLAGERKRLADLTVKAASDGILDDLPWNEGERPAAGSPLAVVLANAAPYARVYVPEPCRARIRPGDELSVHVDGLETPIMGKVRWIAAEPAFTPYYALNQEERARLMFLAEVQLPESEASLPSGVPAQVDLP